MDFRVKYTTRKIKIWANKKWDKTKFRIIYFINFLKKCKDIEYKIDFVIEFYDITPAIYFEKEVLKLLSEIEADIDFDLYNMNN